MPCIRNYYCYIRNSFWIVAVLASISAAMPRIVSPYTPLFGGSRRCFSPGRSLLAVSYSPGAAPSCRTCKQLLHPVPARTLSTHGHGRGAAPGSCFTRTALLTRGRLATLPASETFFGRACVCRCAVQRSEGGRRRAHCHREREKSTAFLYSCANVYARQSVVIVRNHHY